ncbi:uncharacterized protein DNG_09160 [Cephalotrichum gorgonifer]|uniref:Uncharacterized protein n=1 Tax=Cephalotrichum gorgonifer TaxID=2041049 RepID=A0AAE8N555_9PEZI|nr:uncharacterized protein DNG_09160 [Cephalotrichum gorgonifer]
MFADFRPRHIPALFSATAMFFGGLWPLFGADGPRATMIEYGLPQHIAEAPEAAPVMVAISGRTTVIGALMYLLYYRRRYDVVDTIMAVMGFYLAVLDPYALYGLASTSWCVFRGVSTFAFGLMGYYGLTAGR